MNCREIAEFLIDYVDGDLPEPALATFEAHLRACRDCRNYLDGYRKTIAATKAVMIEPPALDVAEMPEQLVSAILAARQGGNRNHGTRS